MFQTTNQVLSPFSVNHSLYGSLPQSTHIGWLFYSKNQSWNLVEL